jgi:hypothetical protein
MLVVAEVATGLLRAAASAAGVAADGAGIVGQHRDAVAGLGLPAPQVLPRRAGGPGFWSPRWRRTPCARPGQSRTGTLTYAWIWQPR